MTSPYSVYSANMVVICNALITRVQAGIALPGTFTTPPLSTAVFYGDQRTIPTTPAICIEPGDKTRTLAGAPQMTQNDFEIYLMVYHNKVQSVETTRAECDQLAYELEHWLHQDLQLQNGGPTPNLIHGYVRTNESGYTVKAGTLYRSARLTYAGRNKTSLADS